MNKKNIGLLMTIVFLQSLLFYYPIATLYRTQCGLTLSQIAWIESLSFLATLLFELPWGFVADKIGYKKVLVLSNLLYFLSKILFYYATDFPSFLAERLLVGITVAGLTGCDTALLYRSCDVKRRPTVFAVYSALQTAGLLIGSLGYGLLMNGDFQRLVWITALCYAAAFILTFFLDDDSIKETKNAVSLKGLKDALLANRSYLAIAIGSLIYSEVIRESVSLFSQIKLSELQWPISLFGLVSFLITLAGLSGFAAGFFQKHCSRKRLLFFFYALSSISLAAIGATQSRIAALVGLLIVNACASLLAPILSVLEQEQVVDAYRASMISAYSIVGCFLSGTLDVALGYFADRAIALAYYWSAALVLFALVLAVRYFRKQR